jgi:hypothetical protein
MISLNEALVKARNELAMSVYLSETAPNAGLQVIYENKAEWLCQLLWAANQYQKLLEEK